jgi:Ca2+-binding RTX toxin-like protein
VVNYSASTAGITVNLITGTGSAGGDAQGDILSGIENIVGSGFSDTITGSAAVNVIDGGAGTDTLSYAGSAAAVTVNLSTGTGSGGNADGDIISGIENVTGSDHNDTLIGDAGVNVPQWRLGQRHPDWWRGG